MNRARLCGSRSAIQAPNSTRAYMMCMIRALRCTTCWTNLYNGNLEPFSTKVDGASSNAVDCNRARFVYEISESTETDGRTLQTKGSNEGTRQQETKHCAESELNRSSQNMVVDEMQDEMIVSNAGMLGSSHDSRQRHKNRAASVTWQKVTRSFGQSETSVSAET